MNKYIISRKNPSPSEGGGDSDTKAIGMSWIKKKHKKYN